MPPRSNKDRPLAALIVPDLLELLEEHPESIGPQTEEMHPADLADVAEALPEEQVRAFLTALPRERAAEVLEYLDEELRTQVLEEFTAQEAAEIVAEMTPDERADALDELDEETADEILQELEPAEKAETERLLQYDPYTAGGLMTTEFVAVEETLTVEESLRAVRAMAKAGRREAMYTIYTVDANGRLRGVLSLRELLAAPEGSRISEHAWSEVVSVSPDTPQKFGGMEALEEPYMQISLWQNVRKRGGWLAVLAVSEMLTASVMARYEDDLGRVILLAQFIPLIMSSGGNSGSQATSLIIRAMALGEVSLGDWWRVVQRELPAGLILGIMLGTLAALRISAWAVLGLYDYGPHHTLLAFTVGLTLVAIVTIGSLTGSMLPFLLKRVGFDPASASAPFVATLVDVSAISIYFSVAYLLLRGTLL